MSVKDGRLALPDGMSYRVLVLPEVPTMTPGLLRKVRDLVKGGATVIGLPPAKSPSLSGYPQCDAEVRKVAEELWGNGVMEWWSDGKRSNGNTPTLQHSGAPLARGQVIWDDTVKPAQRASDAGNPLEQAKWVWFNEGNPAASAPVGKRYFRQAFVLADVPGVESARVFMTADNSFELWVNGRKAGSGDNFHVASALDVKPMLRRGTNLVAVAAENGGEAPNPAGLVGTVVVRFQDGHTLVVPTDGSWQASQEVGSGWPRDAAGEGSGVPRWNWADGHGAVGGRRAGIGRAGVVLRLRHRGGSSR